MSRAKEGMVLGTGVVTASAMTASVRTGIVTEDVRPCETHPNPRSSPSGSREVRPRRSLPLLQGREPFRETARLESAAQASVNARALPPGCCYRRRGSPGEHARLPWVSRSGDERRPAYAFRRMDTVVEDAPLAQRG